MSKINRETIEKSKNSIKRGAYYFGIIGRLSLFFGFFTLIAGGIEYLLIDHMVVTTSSLFKTISFDSVENIIYGFLFLMARDAFLAINALSNEVEEIV